MNWASPEEDAGGGAERSRRRGFESEQSLRRWQGELDRSVVDFGCLIDYVIMQFAGLSVAIREN